MRKTTGIHRVFVTLVAGLGWLGVAWALLAQGPAPSAWQAGLLLVVVVGARALAFPVRGAAQRAAAKISLDSAIFIAATALLGTHVTVPAVALIMTGDRLVRWLARGNDAGRARPFIGTAVGDSLFVGGLSGGLLHLWARVFGIGAGATPEGDIAVWLVPALGAAFLVSHYLVQSLEQRLAGGAWPVVMRRTAATVLAEASLLPLAAGIVLMWDPARADVFGLLGATYLLVNLGFNRLAKLAAQLRNRVDELETLSRTARTLGTSLDLPEVLEGFLSETSRALPAASGLEVTLIDNGAVERHQYRPGRGASVERVADGLRRLRLQREPVLDREVHDEDAPWVRTRMTVPLVMHGETIGSLQADSSREDEFGADELRLLDALGGQVTAAVSNARLYALANIDGLTSLYCRRYLDLRLAEEIERSRRFGASFALVLLDIDNFKQLNDTYGHLVGDRALREISAITANQLRGVDLAARFGGEELAFLLPNTSLADAHAVAERIRQAVAAHQFHEASRRIPMTVSIGVAGWAEAGAGDAASIVGRADEALYRAKRGGKNRVEIDLQSFELTPSLAPVIRRRPS